MKTRQYSTAEANVSKFNITIRFEGGLTAGQQGAFAAAADRWSRIILGNLPPVRVDDDEVDDVLILARGSNIDGRGGILGQAGPTHLRPHSGLPAKGIMSFDVADLQNMEQKGTLGDVIAHEMGHVIGIGTLWSRKNLLLGASSNDPVFTGDHATREYSELRSSSQPSVPVANTGGPGTKDAHWRERVFGNELMSGFILNRDNPISRVTVGSLEDLGYEVDYSAAEPYHLPELNDLVEFGLLAGVLETDHAGHGMMFIPDQEVLSEDMML